MSVFTCMSEEREGKREKMWREGERLGRREGYERTEWWMEGRRNKGKHRRMQAYKDRYIG